MPANLGDLIQVVDRQEYLEQELLNVYFYRVTSVTGLNDSAYEEIADWFVTNVIGAVVAIQADVLIHTGVEVRNLSNNLDFYEDAISIAGDVAAAADNLAPSYVTAGWQLIRESLATRNGYKRFSGLNDLQIQGNTLVIAQATTDAISAALAADIVLGAVTVAEPVIVKRPLVPPVGSAFTYSSIGAARFRGLGTQNTRKP